MTNAFEELTAVPEDDRDDEWAHRLLWLPDTLAKAGQPPPSPAEYDAVVMATAAARPGLFDGSYLAYRIRRAITHAREAADTSLADRYLLIGMSVVESRLRGLAMPDDLRAMALLQWTSSTESWVRPEMTVLHNGDPASINEDESLVADRELLRHAAMVACGSQISSVGYWLHPGEPAREFPPIVVIGDDPWEWTILATGCTLVEAMIWDCCRRGGNYDEALFEEYAEPLRRQGVPVMRRGEPKGKVSVDPFNLWEETYQAAVKDANG